MDIRARIAEATSAADQLGAYYALTDELVRAQQADMAQILFDYLLEGGSCEGHGTGGGLDTTGKVQMVVARPALAYLSEEVKGFTSQPDLKSFCIYALDKLKRNTSFAKSDRSLKMNLAECFLQEDCFAEAAETLACIDLGQAQDVSARFKANINVRCAELFMDESVDDCGKADIFVR